MAVGGLVVLITMVGLMSTLTTNVIERTKEVGMMRCLGSKSGHIRSVFAVEGLTLSLIGWVAGIPLGFAIGTYINYHIYNLMQLELTYLYPVSYILMSFLLMMGISMVIIQPPLWRATHLRPGDALRYE
jgi:ABC-type lipoprotein release transport system permease subunit